MPDELPPEGGQGGGNPEAAAAFQASVDQFRALIDAAQDLGQGGTAAGGEGEAEDPLALLAEQHQQIETMEADHAARLAGIAEEGGQRLLDASTALVDGESAARDRRAAISKEEVANW